jgi:hypothetical protein
VLVVMGNCKREDFMVLPFSRRKLFFAFLRQESARYYGRAVRQRDTETGKRGSPLPALRFPTPQDASAYRHRLEVAFKNLTSHIQNPLPAVK